jgi:hypothetical protein
MRTYIILQAFSHHKAVDEPRSEKKKSTTQKMLFLPSRLFGLMLLIYEVQSFVSYKVGLTAKLKCSEKCRIENLLPHIRLADRKILSLKRTRCCEFQYDIQLPGASYQDGSFVDEFQPCKFHTTVRLASLAGDAEAVAQLRCRLNLITCPEFP